MAVCLGLPMQLKTSFQSVLASVFHCTAIIATSQEPLQKFLHAQSETGFFTEGNLRLAICGTRISKRSDTRSTSAATK